MTVVLKHIPCPVCPSSDAFYRWKDGHGHCFSCGYHENPNRTISSIKSKLDDIPELSKELSQEDYVYTIAPKALKWLSSYGIRKEEILKYKLMWNNKTSSLVYPVFSQLNPEKIIATNERYFGTNENFPKYISKGKIHSNLRVLSEKGTNLIVLVEDFVSAIKISRLYAALPLFGASVPTSVIVQLCERKYVKVVIWLDRNKAASSMVFRLKLSQFLPDVRVVLSELDPKGYTIDEIDERIRHA